MVSADGGVGDWCQLMVVLVIVMSAHGGVGEWCQLMALANGVSWCW